MCAFCDYVLLIKITIVRERRAVSASLSRLDLAGARGKTVSRRLELNTVAVDACMTTTSIVPRHALRAPQHAAALPFGPLNHSYDSCAPAVEADFT